MKVKTILDSSMGFRNLNVGRVVFMRNYFSHSVSLAPVPYLLSILGLERSLIKEVANLGIIGLGVVSLSLLAQVKLALPWTPVPITGQTFGVLLIALLMGRNRAFSTVFLYLLAGVLGYPVFAQAQSALTLTPTSGYLAGMLISSFVVGWLSDRGWSQKFGYCFLAGLISSTIIFASGLFVLSYFVPSDALLSAGLIPFLPGDLLKTTLAAVLVAPVSYSIRRL